MIASAILVSYDILYFSRNIYLFVSAVLFTLFFSPLYFVLIMILNGFK